MSNPVPAPQMDDWTPVPDEAFLDDLFAGVPSDLDDLQLDDLFGPDVQAQPEGFLRAASLNEGWGWHDARLIGVERETEEGMRFEIGAIDLYVDIDSSDLGGSYLPIASFSDVDVAAAFYHDLQQQIHNQGLAAHEVPGFAEQQAFAMNPEPENWRGAEAEEYAVYEHLRSLEYGDIAGSDEPPDQALDPLLQTALEMGGMEAEQNRATPLPSFDDRSAFQALNTIGVEAEDFNPNRQPPPFYDTQTDTAYWIGVFQADRDDHQNCVTSILSLGRNPDTGEMQAQLAPCMPREWDTAYRAAEELIEIAQREGIDRCFDAAENLALQAGQRDLWEGERGVALEPDTVWHTWEIEI